MKYWIYIGLITLLFSCGESALPEPMASNEVGLNSDEEIPAFTDQKISEEGTITVNGNVSESVGSLIQLNYIAQGKIEPAGTATIDADGNFSIETSAQDPGFYNVAFSNENSFLLFLEPGSTTEISAEGANLFASYQLLEAGKDSKLMKEYFTEYNSFYLELQTINEAMEQLAFNDDKGREKFIKQSEAKRDIFNAFKHNFIEENIESPVMVTMIDHLDPGTEMDYITKIGAAVQKSLPNTHYATIIQNAVKKKAQDYMMASAPQRIQKGSMAPDIEFPDPNGKVIKLSSLKGKVVLLDFWASWCKPCRAENPRVVKLYNQYKNKGFEIFSFSLDKEKARWTNAIQADGLIWPNHASDLKGWQTATIPIYGYNSIPFTVLIDTDGKIIETNLRGQQLENKLKSILG
jgi:thiol-disulfide isomerase/thioredoxin